MRLILSSRTDYASEGLTGKEEPKKDNVHASLRRYYKEEDR